MKKLTIYDSGAAEDLFFCISATLCAAWFNADTYLPDGPMKWIRIGAFTGMSLCWFSMSFFNGLRMRKRFAWGMVIFLTVPCICSLLCENIRALKFSDAGLLLHGICSMISRLPYILPEEALKINGMLFSAAAAVLCLLLYASGYLYAKKIISDAAEEAAERID